MPASVLSEIVALGPTVSARRAPTGADGFAVGGWVTGGGGVRLGPGADVERAPHLGRVRVALEGVPPVDEVHPEGLLADERDGGADVDAAGPEQVEVVLLGLVVHLDLELARLDARHGACPGRRAA